MCVNHISIKVEGKINSLTTDFKNLITNENKLNKQKRVESN